ncbi:hypothetical protein B0H12DRAFT_1235783 [Mycena haematopus]|nr:hypothetical protein B0H12DRAFT_1235783 [Mycena haematopus]
MGVHTLVKKFFEELFNYCFPVDFRSQQRKNFYKFSQGSLAVRDYCTELQFWDGAHTWIQREWAHDGYDPETASLKQLVRAAVNYEQAQKLVDAINESERSTDESDESEPQTSEFGSQTEDMDSGDDAMDESETNELQSEGRTSDSGSQRSSKSEDSQAVETSDSDEEESVDDSDESNTSAVESRSVSFAQVERLRDMRDAYSLGLFSMSIEQPPGSETEGENDCESRHLQLMHSYYGKMGEELDKPISDSYFPHSNAKTERANGTIRRMLVRSMKPNLKRGPWVRCLPGEAVEVNTLAGGWAVVDLLTVELEAG